MCIPGNLPDHGTWTNATRNKEQHDVEWNDQNKLTAFFSTTPTYVLFIKKKSENK